MFRSKIARLFALLTLGTALSAQSLDADVVRNPDDTVTYTLAVDGPPRGSYMLFVSPIALINPFQLPGIGNLHLAPNAIFRIGPVLPLNANGRGQLQLRVPVQSIYDRPLHFQALVIDPMRNLRTTDFLSTWYKESHNFTGGSRSNVKAEPGKRMISGSVKGEPGKIFEVRIDGRGGVARRFRGAIGKNGELVFAFGHGRYQIQHGDRIVMSYDGQAVGMIQY